MNSGSNMLALVQSQAGGIKNMRTLQPPPSMNNNPNATQSKIANAQSLVSKSSKGRLSSKLGAG